MRDSDLTDTLKEAQEAMVIDPLVKIVLTRTGKPTKTYTRDRLLDINHPEEPFSQRATVVLDNSDGVLTNLPLQGFKGVISYGAITNLPGEEYSACAPLWVIGQQFESSPGVLDCTLELIGIMNLMAEDKASESYIPSSDNTDSVRTLINAILGATLPCFTTHCAAVGVDWEAGYDTLADTYIPKDSFRIYVGGSRLAAFRRLLDYTGNVARVQKDGHIHIFKPTTSGVVYDSQYSLESGHSFFSKAYRNRLVIPNRIVVQSQPDDVPFCSGSAQIEGYDALPAELKKTDYKQMRLASSDPQANDIAAAMLSIHQLWSEMGAANVPMNVGAEVFDYVKVAALCAEDVFRVGNLGYLTRHVNLPNNEWRMTFSFGNWMTVRKALAGLDTTGSISTDDLEQYFTRLMVKDLYAEHIQADNMDMIWLDPEGNIKAEELGDFLDHIPQGEHNALVKAMHLDASGLYFESTTIYTVRLSGSQVAKLWKGDDPQASPDEGDFWIDTRDTPDKVMRWNGSAWQELPAEDRADLEKGIFVREVKSSSLTAEGLVFLKELDDSGDYKRIKGLALSAEGMVLLDRVVEGDHGLVLKTDISEGHIKGSAIVQSAGFRLTDDGQIANWDEGYEVALEAYDLGIDIKDDVVAGYLTLSEHTNIDGEWYKTGGVRIHASEGIDIYGPDSAFRTRASEGGAIQCYVGTDGKLYAGGGNVVLDKDGLLIDGHFLKFKFGSYFSYLFMDGNDLVISAYDDILFDLCDLKEISSIYIGDDLYPNPNNTATSLGFSTRYNYQLFANLVRYKNIDSFQRHDDLALLRGLRVKKEKRREPNWIDKGGKKQQGMEKEVEILNSETLPPEIYKDGFYDAGAVSGLLIGAIRQLADKIEVLERGKE